MSRYKAHVARRIQSLTLEAEAQHSWLDVISSCGALVGLAGVAFGWRIADPIAGFFVTLFICHVGYEVTSQIVHHLMDGVDAEHLSTAEAAGRSVSGVRSATARGRWMGRSLLLDIQGEMDAETLLVHATEIGRKVEDAVHAAVPEARQVRWMPIALTARSTPVARFGTVATQPACRLNPNARTVCDAHGDPSPLVHHRVHSDRITCGVDAARRDPASDSWTTVTCRSCLGSGFVEVGLNRWIVYAPEEAAASVLLVLEGAAALIARGPVGARPAPSDAQTPRALSRGPVRG